VASTDLSIPSGPFRLRGTLTGNTARPGPGALLISGSGPIDRNSNAKRLPLGVMGQIADHLAGRGVVTLRYDKRGVGQSDGEFLSTGFHDNVDDAQAALEVLRARPEVDPGQVSVIGHSEGALIASVLAEDRRLAGVVLIAGSVVNGREVLRWQARQVAETLPAPVRWLTKVFRQDVLEVQAKRLARIEASTDDVMRLQFVRVNAKWFREFMAFEPAPALRHAAAPVLAITGSKDIQVDPAAIDIMRGLVPSPFSGHVVEDLTHILRTEAGPPSLRTYKKQARRPVDHRLLDLIGDWIGVPAPAGEITSGE